MQVVHLEKTTDGYFWPGDKIIFFSSEIGTTIVDALPLYLVDATHTRRLFEEPVAFIPATHTWFAAWIKGRKANGLAFFE